MLCSMFSSIRVRLPDNLDYRKEINDASNLGTHGIQSAKDVAVLSPDRSAIGLKLLGFLRFVCGASEGKNCVLDRISQIGTKS